ncbi:ABC transporter ATP-binding protein [Nocardioides sp. Bht2]|uniref:ABC transporter ATP-binding protein n=1 Tax=Nocardioides sp. Bht2 TaxID=3392297 RepID=UPI0039B4E8EC
MGVTAALSAHGLAVGYPGRRVIEGLDVEIVPGQLTVIVGPNACGKSTLLRTMARMLNPEQGEVRLHGTPVTSMGSRQVARQLAVLPQSPSAPDGMVVRDLVARGRYPHQRLLKPWSRDDDAAVEAAMRATDVVALADADVNELSGGQRQRVWLAMALAQETEVLLLDEPTSFLDIAHQIEVLDLGRALQRQGRTVVMVLHELHLAFRYADQLVVMKGGRIMAQGSPGEVVTAELIEEVYDLPCRIIADPETGSPMVIPLAGRGR